MRKTFELYATHLWEEGRGGGGSSLKVFKVFNGVGIGFLNLSIYAYIFLNLLA